MRKLAFGLTICISVLGTVVGAAESDERQILELEQTWVRALESEDRAILDRIVASDFTFIEPDGRMLTRDSYLKDRSHNQAEIHEFDASEMAVRVFGDTALVTGLATIDESVGGKRYKYKLRWKEMWIRRGGSWQVLAGQATPLNTAWNAPFEQP